jgi:hypothetical protein
LRRVVQLVFDAVSQSMAFDQGTSTLTVGPIKMTIVQGDITKNGADAIVNSTDERMSMGGK